MTTESESLNRLLQAISHASEGAFTEALELLQRSEERDSLTPLATALETFIRDLEQSVRAKEEALGELQISQVELEQALSTVQKQQMAIQDLGTPIIDVWDDIVALPVVGIIDTQRALAMTEKLLGRIADARARCVIIDLTGVELVDSKTAEYLADMTRAADMLGSFCVITGIGPDVAQTLVQLGVDLGSVETLRSLKEGLRVCFQHLQQIRRRPSTLR